MVLALLSSTRVGKMVCRTNSRPSVGRALDKKEYTLSIVEERLNWATSLVPSARRIWIVVCGWLGSISGFKSVEVSGWLRDAGWGMLGGGWGITGSPGTALNQHLPQERVTYLPNRVPWPKKLPPPAALLPAVVCGEKSSFSRRLTFKRTSCPNPALTNRLGTSPFLICRNNSAVEGSLKGKNRPSSNENPFLHNVSSRSIASDWAWPAGTIGWDGCVSLPRVYPVPVNRGWDGCGGGVIICAFCAAVRRIFWMSSWRGFGCPGFSIDMPLDLVRFEEIGWKEYDFSPPAKRVWRFSSSSLSVGLESW